MPYHVQTTRLEVEVEQKAILVAGRLGAEELKVESALASTEKQGLIDAAPSVI